MAMLTTTVTSKRQVTIPKEIDKDFPVNPGMRLTWSVQNGVLMARRARTIADLAGCLKSEVPFPGDKAELELAVEQQTRHYRRKYRKA